MFLIKKRKIIKRFKDKNNVCTIEHVDMGSGKKSDIKKDIIEHESLIPCQKCGGVAVLRGSNSWMVGASVRAICTNCGEYCEVKEWGQYSLVHAKWNEMYFEDAILQVVKEWNQQEPIIFTERQHPRKKTIYADKFVEKMKEGFETTIYKREFWGNSLERILYCGSGTIIVDNAIKPHLGDLVHCSGILYNGELVKEVVYIGDDVIVSSCYFDKRKNKPFATGEVYGTVVKVVDDDGYVVYERGKSDLRNFQVIF